MKCSYCEAKAIGFESSRYSASCVQRLNVCARCAHVGARVHRFDGTSYRKPMYVQSFRPTEKE